MIGEGNGNGINDDGIGGVNGQGAESDREEDEHILDKESEQSLEGAVEGAKGAEAPAGAGEGDLLENVFGIDEVPASPDVEEAASGDIDLLERFFCIDKPSGDKPRDLKAEFWNYLFKSQFEEKATGYTEGNFSAEAPDPAGNPRGFDKKELAVFEMLRNYFVFSGRMDNSRNKIYFCGFKGVPRAEFFKAIYFGNDGIVSLLTETGLGDCVDEKIADLSKGEGLIRGIPENVRKQIINEMFIKLDAFERVARLPARVVIPTLKMFASLYENAEEVLEYLHIAGIQDGNCSVRIEPELSNDGFIKFGQDAYGMDCGVYSLELERMLSPGNLAKYYGQTRRKDMREFVDGMARLIGVLVQERPAESKMVAYNAIFGRLKELYSHKFVDAQQIQR